MNGTVPAPEISAEFLLCLVNPPDFFIQPGDLDGVGGALSESPLALKPDYVVVQIGELVQDVGQIHDGFPSARP
jgi:hypothetical protein